MITITYHQCKDQYVALIVSILCFVIHQLLTIKLTVQSASACFAGSVKTVQFGNTLSRATFGVAQECVIKTFEIESLNRYSGREYAVTH